MSTWPTPPGGPLFVDTRMGTLTIGGESMFCPAWVMLDLLPLWLGAAVRGKDRTLPGATGVKPFRRRQTVTTLPMPMLITGYVDRFGAFYTNPFAGLEANIDFLRTNVVDPTNTGDGTRPAVMTMPSGQTRSANIHVEPLVETSQAGPIVQATLNISIATGVLT